MNYSQPQVQKLGNENLSQNGAAEYGSWVWQETVAVAFAVVAGVVALFAIDVTP